MEEKNIIPNNDYATEAKDMVTTADNSAFTQEEQNAFAAIKLKSQISDIERLKSDVIAKVDEIGHHGNADDTDLDFIDKRIENMTKEQIKALTEDELNEIFTNEEGTAFLEIANGSKEETAQFRRDYLDMRYESAAFIKGMDEEVAKLNEASKEFDDDMKKILGDFDDMTAYLKNTLQKKADNAATDNAKNLYLNMIKTIDDALTLEPVIKFYENSYREKLNIIDIRNVSSKKGRQIIKNFETVVGKLNSKTDFRRFGGLEEACLKGKYKDTYPDTFMYAMLNYIASWIKVEDNTLNGLFLAQFSINLKNLVFNKFAHEEDKNTFVDAICKVIDITG